MRYIWVAGRGDSYSVFLLNLPSIATAREILEKLKTLDGVEAARVEILEERVELYDRLRDNVAERLRSIRGREVPIAAR
ncbi:MAG: hypothetical protein OK455_11120 [Thaumarchaeota archaeon]|nr:hypothetical protein [Nitrososphaerota archaeon]